MPRGKLASSTFPLLQFIVSFVILFLYWELGITVPKRDSHSTLTSEAIIVLIVFMAYLTWDCLEIAVQESDKYLDKLKNTAHSGMLPPLAQEYTARPGRRSVRTRSRWFAKDARAGRVMTVAYALLSALGLITIISCNLHGTTDTVIV